MRLFRSKTASWLVAASWLGIARGSSNSVLVWENTSTYASHIGFPDQAVFCVQTPGEPDTWNLPYTINGSGSILVREVNLYITSDKVWRVGTATQGSSKLSGRLTPAPGHIKKSTDFLTSEYDNLLDTRESTKPLEALIPGVLTLASTQTGGSITITSLATLITLHGGAEMYLELIWQNGDKNFSRPFTVVDAKNAEVARKNPIYSSSAPYGSDLAGVSDGGGDGGNDGAGNGNGVVTQNPLSGSSLPATEALPFPAASTTSGSATSLGSPTTIAPTSTSTGLVTATSVPMATSAATAASNSGLSTGAKAGIAVAAAIAGLALLAGLVFLFLRRRRRRSIRSHDSAYFENQHNPELMAQKEATVATVDVTPTSPYFDHGGSRMSVQQPIMAQTRGGDGERGSRQYHDQGVEASGDARPGSVTAGSLTGRVTPHGTVSHLVEDGMTEEEIRRLEEEERELDQAIEQAGAGRRG